jgi:hypothetical protein
LWLVTARRGAGAFVAGDRARAFVAGDRGFVAGDQRGQRVFFQVRQKKLMMMCKIAKIEKN